MINLTKFLAVLTVATSICTQTTLVAQEEPSANTALIGGKILTMDVDERVVTAIAIRDGRILAVGSDDEVRKFCDDNTEVVELGGKTVIPGIIAAHCHAVGVAKNV